MQNIEELYSVFQKLIHLITYIPLNRIILANQGRSPPAGNLLYATYNPVPIRAYGRSARTREEIAPIEDIAIENGTDWRETIYTSMEYMLSVNFINGDAANAASLLHNADCRIPIAEFLYKNEIAWRYVSAVRNLTSISQSGIQPRYQSDIYLFIEQVTSYTLLRAMGFSNTFIIEDNQCLTP